MAGITLAQAQTNLDAWITASTAIASSQSYEIETGNGRRKLTRADVQFVTQQITFWDQKVKELTPVASGGKRRIRYVVPE